MPTHILKFSKGIKNKGGSYFTSNMRKSPDGIGLISDYNLSNSFVHTAGATSEWLYDIRNWVEKMDGTTTTYWGLGASGDGKLNLYVVISGSLFLAIKGTQAMTTSSITRRNGLIVDFGNEVIAVGTRYIGRTITTTLNGAVAIGATTIDVTSATNLPTAGEIFISDGTNSETFSYTGKNVNQLTGVTKGLYNTTDQAHVSGKTVFGFKNDWHDLEASGVGGAAIKFQDYILVANAPYIAGWSAVDGSDFDVSLTSFTIPAYYSITDLSLITTGAGERVLISVEKGNEGALIVWDGVSADWDIMIPLSENPARLLGDIVAMDSGIYQTDGYTLRLLAPLPDDEGEINSSDLRVSDMKRKGDMLLITTNSAKLNRNRSGLWMLDLNDFDWSYIQPSNKGAYGIDFVSIFISSSWDIYVSTTYGSGAIDSLSSTPCSRGNYVQILYDPQATRVLRLKDFRLGLSLKQKTYINNEDFNFDIIVRYYTFTKAFLQYSSISGASADAGEIKLTQTSFGLPVAGDRIEVIEKTTVAQPDIAGAIRNITSITTAAGVHTCELDENLPATPSAASASSTVLINPLIKTEKKSFTGRTLDPKDLVFAAKGYPDFKKMIVEVEIRNNGSTTIAPQLDYLEVNSEDSQR
jgi:hypothetical protein